MNTMTDKQDCWYDKTGKQTTNILWRAMAIELNTQKTLPLIRTQQKKIKNEETSTGVDICKVRSRRQCYM